MQFKKYSATVATVLGILLILSCEDHASLQKNPAATSSATGTMKVTNYSFDGTEGNPIPGDVALRWTANYADKNPDGTRAHFFGADRLTSILGKEGCVGIRIYYSIDDAGTSSLLLIGADNRGNDILPVFGMKGKASAFDIRSAKVSTETLSRTVGDLVAGDVSKRWTNSYVQANPDHLQAHFFGYQLVQQILGQNDCVGIRMYYAFNDAGIPQVLLVGVNSKGGNMLPSGATGRSEDGGNTVGDFSLPCPTYCSGG